MVTVHAFAIVFPAQVSHTRAMKKQKTSELKKRYTLTVPPFSKEVICKPSELKDQKEAFAENITILPKMVRVKVKEL